MVVNTVKYCLKHPPINKEFLNYCYIFLSEFEPVTPRLSNNMAQKYITVILSQSLNCLRDRGKDLQCLDAKLVYIERSRWPRSGEGPQT